MPFKSVKQRAYLAINKPEVAKKFSEHSKPNEKSLKDRLKMRYGKK